MTFSSMRMDFSVLSLLQSPLAFSWQRVNTGTITVSLNYTFQISRIMSSFHCRTLLTNSFFTASRTGLHWTHWVAPTVFLITTLYRSKRNRRFQQYSIVVGVFTNPLPRNGLHNHFVLLLLSCILRALPSNGRCLQQRVYTPQYIIIILL
jgi:hypothetical protein